MIQAIGTMWVTRSALTQLMTPGINVSNLKERGDLGVPGTTINPNHVSHTPSTIGVSDDHAHAWFDAQETRDLTWALQRRLLDASQGNGSITLLRRPSSVLWVSLQLPERVPSLRLWPQTLNPSPISVLMSCRRLLAHSSPDRSFGISWVLPCAH